MATTESTDNLTPVLVVGGLVLLGSGLASLALGADTTELLLGIAGGIVTAGVVIGTYVLSRRFDQPHSHAVAWAAVSFGTLFLMGAVFQLMYSHGAADDPSALGVGLRVVGGLVATLVVVGLIALFDRKGPSYT